MPWWSRGTSVRPAAHLPIGVPHPDGTGWPDAPERPTFASRTLHETGLRFAYDPEVSALAERLVSAALARLALQVSREDAPYLRGVLLAAARTGAGIGTAERSQAPAPPGHVDRDVAAALALAGRGLPALPADRAWTAPWFVLAGRHLAVHGDDALVDLLLALDLR